MSMPAMNTAERLQDCASELVDAARVFQAAAEQPGSHSAASGALTCLEEALQALSAGWYRLAADAAPGVAGWRDRSGSGTQSSPTVDGLSREQEVRLVGALHDVAAAFARGARACRVGRSSVRPIIGPHVSARPAGDPSGGDGLSWFEPRQPPPPRAAQTRSTA
jgi:hypothetical protein